MTPPKELYDSVKEHMDEDGWFPDNILGQSFWVLSYCERKQVGEDLYWRFVNMPEEA